MCMSAGRSGRSAERQSFSAHSSAQEVTAHNRRRCCWDSGFISGMFKDVVSYLTPGSTCIKWWAEFVIEKGSKQDIKKMILLNYRRAVCFWALCSFYFVAYKMVISFVLCLFLSADKERFWQDDQKGTEQVYFCSASSSCFLQDLCVFLMNLIFKETVFNTASLPCSHINVIYIICRFVRITWQKCNSFSGFWLYGWMSFLYPRKSTSYFDDVCWEPTMTFVLWFI